MTDETLIINHDDPPTPAEQAALGYLDLRRLLPLPAGWTQGFTIVPADRVRAKSVPPPEDASQHGQEHLIACYPESPHYAVELLFMSYPQSSDRPGDQPATGGFRLEFYRKDGGAPTPFECNEILRVFGLPVVSAIPLE